MNVVVTDNWEIDTRWSKIGKNWPYPWAIRKFAFYVPICLNTQMFLPCSCLFHEDVKKWMGLQQEAIQISSLIHKIIEVVRDHWDSWYGTIILYHSCGDGSTMHFSVPSCRPLSVAVARWSPLLLSECIAGALLSPLHSKKWSSTLLQHRQMVCLTDKFSELSLSDQ